MSSVKVDWDTAKVKDAKLAVELEGEVSSNWKDRFEATIRLLGHGDWGEVRVKKNAVRVSKIVPGSEENLRHHIEGAIQQANATVARAESASDEEEEPDRSDQDDGPDGEMTRRFRSFAR